MIESITDIYRDDYRVVALALGGSRARNRDDINSDYDVFMLIAKGCFNDFRLKFAYELEDKLNFIVAEEMFYIESWGYIFKAIDFVGVQYDISILPENRIDEMGIKSSNVVLFDKNGLYTKEVLNANDDIDNQLDIMISNKVAYEKKFIIDTYKFLLAWKREDYWVVVKYLERLRFSLMLLLRIKNETVGKMHFSPEKNFSVDVGTDLEKNFNSYGLLNIKMSFNYLVGAFLAIIGYEEREKFHKSISLAGHEFSKEGLL